MLRIGEFARISGLSIKTLRFYDETGLIKPDFVDTNGYRYYNNAGLEKANRIIELRQLGISINDIKKILSGTDLVEVLKARKIEIEKEIAQNQKNVTKIEELIGRMTGDGERGSGNGNLVAF
mgnify:CR=1 FL=1